MTTNLDTILLKNSKRLFVSKYINILVNDYKNNRELLLKHIEYNKNDKNKDFLERFFYDKNIFHHELSKYPDIKYYLNNQIELNKQINIGQLILRTDLK